MKPISTCKGCFKDLKFNNFHSLLNPDLAICNECIYESHPEFIRFKINGVNSLALFSYNDFIRNKIYIYKGCEDYEMKDFFLSPYLAELKIFYSDFVIVPIPSYLEDDKKRGFNHVIEIFKCLNLQIIPFLIKTKNIKQKELNFEERQKISDILISDKSISLKHKKVLIVDDVITTGASMKAAINLVKLEKPKRIEVLAIAKRIMSEEELKKHKNIKKL